MAEFKQNQSVFYNQHINKVTPHFTFMHRAQNADTHALKQPRLSQNISRVCSSFELVIASDMHLESESEKRWFTHSKKKKKKIHIQPSFSLFLDDSRPTSDDDWYGKRYSYVPASFPVTSFPTFVVRHGRIETPWRHHSGVPRKQKLSPSAEKHQRGLFLKAWMTSTCSFPCFAYWQKFDFSRLISAFPVHSI